MRKYICVITQERDLYAVMEQIDGFEFNMIGKKLLCGYLKKAIEEIKRNGVWRRKEYFEKNELRVGLEKVSVDEENFILYFAHYLEAQFNVVARVYDEKQADCWLNIVTLTRDKKAKDILLRNFESLTEQQLVDLAVVYQKAKTEIDQLNVDISISREKKKEMKQLTKKKIQTLIKGFLKRVD